MEFFAYQLIIKIPCISPTETSHIHVPVRSIKSSPRWKLSEMISLLEINVYNDRTHRFKYKRCNSQGSVSFLHPLRFRSFNCIIPVEGNFVTARRDIALSWS